MVESRVGEDFEAGADGAAFGVVGAVDEAGDAGLNDGAGAHAAGLDGDVKGGVGEAVVAEEASGLAEDDDFGVGGGVTIAGGAVAGTGEDLAIGAVLVHDGKILARSGNRTTRDCDPTLYAEIVVLREAARRLANYRLADTTLYVTIEPCSMCAGAIIQARVPRLVYGADDPKGGAVRSCFEILTHPRLNHLVEVTRGVLAADCAAILQSFFAERR